MKKEDINCPHCGKKNTYQLDNPFRPFCSERCKLIDLGKWADESNKIPGPSITEQDLENLDEQPDQHHKGE